MLDGHGDDIYRYDDLVKMNFSSNIFQHVDHTALKQHLMEHFDVVGNYPEPQPRQLERLIARQEGQEVIFTEGVIMSAPNFDTNTGDGQDDFESVIIGGDLSVLEKIGKEEEEKDLVGASASTESLVITKKPNPQDAPVVAAPGHHLTRSHNIHIKLYHVHRFLQQLFVLVIDIFESVDGFLQCIMDRLQFLSVFPLQALRLQKIYLQLQRAQSAS